MLLIFDWDGTLMDSADKIVGCMQRASLRCGLAEPSDAAVRHIIGLGLGEAVAQLHPGINAAGIERMRETYAEEYIAADQAPCTFFPGVEAVLAQCQAEGHLLAVATGKSRRGLDRILKRDGMERYFHASRCADETLSKPNPLMLQEICEELAVPPAEAIMVGDTSYDLEMARNIGMASVGVSYGAHAVDTLRQYQPLAIIDAFSDLLAVVSQFQQGAALAP